MSDFYHSKKTLHTLFTLISICDNAYSSTELIIGDAKHGFYLGKIKQILEKYIEISNNYCFNCWLCRICPACYITALNPNGIMDEQTKLKKCKVIKKFYERAFMFIIKLTEEEKIHIFDSLKLQNGEKDV